MQKWILKAAVQKVISYAPFSQKLNYFFQKHVTGGVRLSQDHFELKLRHAKDHILKLREHCTNIEQVRCLELGSGWYPIVPIALFLEGVEHISSVDLNPLMTKAGIVETLKMFKASADKLENDRWRQLVDILDEEDTLSLEQMCTALGLTLWVGDARSLPLDDKSIDFICSNNTFEHIAAGSLKQILTEFKRVSGPGALMSHFIDLSDHFAHFDKSISIYNFLRFSRRQWNLIDNSIQPQNRMRWKDYIELYAELDIPVSEQVIWPYDIKDLYRQPIHRSYDNYSKEELAVSHGYLLSVNSSFDGSEKGPKPE